MTILSFKNMYRASHKTVLPFRNILKTEKNRSDIVTRASGVYDRDFNRFGRAPQAVLLSRRDTHIDTSGPGDPENADFAQP